MPITLPVLDDRNYEQILEEALRRVPVYTPEWTSHRVESDPGVTIVQLFAFLTESLLYRANRIPELNRLKFLQLLNVPLRPASAADGLLAIQNERGPIQPLLLEQGVVVNAGNVPFVTRDPLNVLPVQAQVFYKRPIAATDPAYTGYRDQYEAVLAARLAAEADLQGLPFPGSGEFEALGITPQFYEPVALPQPKRGEPLPAFDLDAASDRSLYLALLAPQNVSPGEVRRAIANQVLTIGIAPATSGQTPPLAPMQVGSTLLLASGLAFEIADTSLTTASGVPVARYAPLKLVQQMDVLDSPGLVMVELPDASALNTWEFAEPLEEGTADFPPRLEDEQLHDRLVTWLRIRLPKPAHEEPASGRDHRIAWVGINSVRITQAVPVFNELLGDGNGEPDQAFALANAPALPGSLRLAVQEGEGWQSWMQVDDLLAFGPDDRVYTADAESGVVRFGDGLRGRRPRGRILASYEYGGGPQGNVAIGAVNASRDTRLQGGYKISNPVPTGGGALGETPADGERRIPQVIRHRERLVTLQDFRDITRRAPGVNVGRVEVLPLFKPAEPEPLQDAAGVVTLLVVPRFDALDPLWPSPDRLFLRRICDHLDSRRLVTTEIYVRGPNYLPVFISVGIEVRAGYFVDQVEQDVEQRLRQYLSSLPPGGVDGLGWPLKKRLLRKDLEAVVTRVPGVDFVDSLQMGVGSPQDVEIYSLSGLDLPRVAGVEVRPGAAASLESLFAPTGSIPSLNEGVPIPVSRAKC
ncbi:MAG TPA: putative baseplate assembly protein [Anaerolineae bacterium]|nr:putative baseplate assembly protein [Anaerolineae bacterium]